METQPTQYSGHKRPLLSAAKGYMKKVRTEAHKTGFARGATKTAARLLPFKKGSKALAVTSMGRPAYTPSLKAAKISPQMAKAILKLVERRLATHDMYATNKGIIWDCNQAQQGMVANTNGDIMIQNICNDPAVLVNVIAYLRGFFANLQKFAVLECEATLDIQTRSNAFLYVDLYEFDCIRDVPKNATWTNFQTFYNYGLTNTGATISANGTDPGHTPFQNPLWCQFFHCVKKTSLKMEPISSGMGSARFRWTMPEKQFDYLREGAFSEHIAYAGKTKVVIPVIHGAIGHDSVAPFTQIAYDKAGVMAVYNFRYRTAFFEEAAHDSRFVNTLVQPSTAYQESIVATSVVATGVTTLS